MGFNSGFKGLKKCGSQIFPRSHSPNMLLRTCVEKRRSSKPDFIQLLVIVCVTCKLGTTEVPQHVNSTGKPIWS